MMLADIDLGATALGTWALVAVTVAAVIVAWRAARAANATFRLEAEPRLVVKVVGEMRIFARQGLHQLAASVVPGEPPTPEQISPLDQAPVHLVDGKLGADNFRKVADGFALRTPTTAELNRGQQEHVPVWPALRIEVRNVGRAPAIQVGLKWTISAPMFDSDWRTKQGPKVVTKSAEATLVVDAIGPNDSTFIWLGNATGTQFTLALGSPGYQRDPFDLDSGKTTPISTIAVSTFKLRTADNSI
jgi:hypothetical protein